MTDSFDPLKARQPIHGQEHANSYWAASAGAQPDDDGQLRTDHDTDIAIIGAGFTGLSSAYHLAHEYGVNAVVVDANRPGWGASGRNGGISRPTIGRLHYQDWIAKWGTEGARRHFDEQQSAFKKLQRLIAEGDIDCDLQTGGSLKIAHTENAVQGLVSEQQFLRDVFGYQTELLDQADLERDHFLGAESFGALRNPDGIGIHPMKLSFGLVRMARNAGATVYRDTPVLGWEKDGDWHVLKTPHGRLRAKTVIIATNGYSGEFIHASVKGSTLPVISNVIVTRPMTAKEKAASNFITSHVMMDTRNMLYYYRRLPDDRLLIGGRGPITAAADSLKQWEANLVSVLGAKFPAIKHIDVDYSWHGWVCLTYDSVPHVHQATTDSTVIYGMGYCGSGTTSGVYAGSILADRIAGREPVSSVLNKPMPNYPFAPLRRLGQRAAFRWYKVRDGRR